LTSALIQADHHARTKILFPEDISRCTRQGQWALIAY